MADLPRGTRYEDHLRQATEMVAEQAGVNMAKALQRLIAMSNEIGESLEHTALDVLDGIIRFDE